MKKQRRQGKEVSLKNECGREALDGKIADSSAEKEELKVTNLKKKVESHYQLSVQKARNTELKHGTQDEIQILKAQKVQLLCKSKLDSVHFRISKAALEKEILQLKKEKRKNDFEMRKLLALNEKQKLVLQRKTEEASLATKRLYDLLEPRKNMLQKNSGTKSDHVSGSQCVDSELKLSAKVNEIRAEYERQMEEMAEELRIYEEEAEILREENFRLMLQDKEFDCAARDSELKDLKNEIAKLSDMVGQVAPEKTQQILFKHRMEDINSSGKDEVDTRISSNTTTLEHCSSKTCCSCTKKSLCKTLKCECRAAGGVCGINCGCSTSKCANRKPPYDKLCNAVQNMKVQDPDPNTNSSSEKTCILASENSQSKVLQELGNTPVQVTRKKRSRKPKKVNA